MNDHDRDRIAAALNVARPDWPVKQLRTLLADSRIAERPRRDVFVALAWVACESASASPYRVIEAGPWWRAAAVDGADTRPRDVAPVGSRCTACGLVEDDCRTRWLPTGDQKRDDAQGRHEFTRPHERDLDLHGTVVELKGHIDRLPDLPATSLAAAKETLR